MSQIIVLTLVAFAAVGLAGAQVIGWRNCGPTESATVHEIRVLQTGGPGSNNCETMPCDFVRGNTYDIHVEATAHASSSSLDFEIVGTVLGVNITLTSGDACENMLIGSCPAAPGVRFAFNYEYSVPSTLPAVPALVTSRVFNERDEVVICILVDVHIR